MYLVKKSSSAGLVLSTFRENGRKNFLRNLRGSKPVPKICTVCYNNAQQNWDRIERKKWRTRKTGRIQYLIVSKLTIRLRECSLSAKLVPTLVDRGDVAWSARQIPVAVISIFLSGAANLS
jgi:hypothetical protein